MMKKAIRRHRYHLKRLYFNPFLLHLVRKSSPLRNELIESWATPKKMVCFVLKVCLLYANLDACLTWMLFTVQETSELSKTNRSKVKYHQTTGSHSYMVHLKKLVNYCILHISFENYATWFVLVISEAHVSCNRKAEMQDTNWIAV